MGAPATPTLTKSPVVLPGQDVRVLVVDHRVERRQLMGHVVELGGDDIVVVGYAQDPAGAIDAVKRLDVTAALVEIQIPLPEGLATIAALRAASPSMRIVVCTFHDDEPTRAAALAQGADAYRVKPLSPRELAPLLRPASTA